MYKYDMHVHTREVSPCGKVPVREAVDLYQNAGYDGFVITDHFRIDFFNKLGDLNWGQKIERYLSGYQKAAEYVVDKEFQVFWGLEISFPKLDLDFLLYGLSADFLKIHKNLPNRTLGSFRNLIDRCYDNNVLFFQAHPFRDFLAPVKHLDGLEVFNGNPRHSNHNGKALRCARQHRLKMISGSDFHQREDLARGGIALERKINSIQDLVGSLKGQKNYDLIGKGEDIHYKNKKIN